MLLRSSWPYLLGVVFCVVDSIKARAVPGGNILKQQDKHETMQLFHCGDSAKKYCGEITRRG
jgi:hypothetical protein